MMFLNEFWEAAAIRLNTSIKIDLCQREVTAKEVSEANCVDGNAATACTAMCKGLIFGLKAYVHVLPIRCLQFMPGAAGPDGLNANKIHHITGIKNFKAIFVSRRFLKEFCISFKTILGIGRPRECFL